MMRYGMIILIWNGIDQNVNLIFVNDNAYIGEISYIQKMIGQEARYKLIKNIIKDPRKIRNVSIVAHVDHGKTTLADCLIASNGIIHKKQAGQLKLLDDRLDEQDRGITMKASSIALVHKDHVINLIDSPGHLEFYSEVSTALRLTDAALVLVDTVQGVSSQTFRVLHQLYRQKLPAILVLNKIDKLITHCKMDPMQAFQHLNQLIQHVNAILGSFISKEIGVQKNKLIVEKNQEQSFDSLENHFYFSPSKRNVVFISALDNWGFATESFSSLIAKKLGKQAKQIQPYLWGEFFYNPKTKEFSQKPRNENQRPLCVDWILKPIWDIFQNVENDYKQKIDKIITTLNLKIAESAKKAKGHALIKQILNGWLPLDRLLLEKIVNELPDPIAAQNFRLPYLLQLDAKKEQISEHVISALKACSSNQDAPLIAFVSKMITVSKKQINQRGLHNGVQGNESTIVLGFARIFSGKISRGQEILVISAKPKKMTNENGQIYFVPNISKSKINGLYYFNGQYPEGVEQAYGGCVIGIGGLENQIFKSGTISTIQQCISFLPTSNQTKSILKVSVSTPDIQDNPKLLDGLKKMNRSDPSVDVYVEGSGDIILNTCGQVHLEKCVVDLEKVYCKIPIKISDPIITFRQTITWLSLKQNKNHKFLQQISKKKMEQEKKVLKEQYKLQKLADTELDQQQKEKLRAVKEWDSHVQIYESQDLTVQDCRYFLKNRDDMDQYSNEFQYKKEKEYKKLDHKNRGKLHAKPKLLNLNLKTNFCTLKLPNQKLSIKIRAIGMPFAIAQYLQKQNDRMIKLFTTSKETNKDNKSNERMNQQRIQFVNDLIGQFDEHGLQQHVKQLIISKMICFGPNHFVGTNFLIAQSIQGKSFINIVKDGAFDQEQCELKLDPKVLKLLQEYKTTPVELFTAIKNGFSLACTSGPLANELLMGSIFILEQIKIIQQLKTEIKQQEGNLQKEKKILSQQEQNKIQYKYENNFWNNDNFGPLAGQVISTMKDCCIESFLGAGPRLVQPMYLCQLHTHQQYYGSIHNELAKRRSQILTEDLHEFSNFFIIKAYLPMFASHNFCFDILDRTQGTVNAQLDLDTWKIIQEDPFFTPMTVEEIEQNGIDKNSYNQARTILQKIRQKKGLSGTQKIVVAAQKQRTLKKN